MSEWKLIGKLDKRTDFAGPNPMESLHRKLVGLTRAKGRKVQQFAVTPATNEYLRVRVEKAVRRKYPDLPDRKIETTVAFIMLCDSPCDISGSTCKDFHVYYREASDNE